MRKIKILSLILSASMIISFAACAARAPSEEDFIGNGAIGNLYPSKSESYYSSATGSDDASVNIMGGTNPNNSLEIGGEAEDVMDSPSGSHDRVDDDQSLTNWPVFIENPFVSTSENNTSTFSADVDTASYAYFRKLVNSGYSFKELTYSGATFRTEEFINYFKYDVEAPTENELFGVQTSIIPCPWNRENLLLRVTMQAERSINEKGNNLVFLIDVSGSMQSSDKLPLLKRAFTYLVDNLTENDTISIVTYSGREQVVLEGCKGNKKAEILNAINSLVASGSTNGEAGLKKAYQIAESYMIEGGNNRIIMASDGDLNVGISSTEQLKSFVADKRDQGVYLSVLGFGTGNYRDSKMEAIADNGNGIYYYIDGESEAERVFATDLLGTLYTVAEDVKLQIEFNSDSIESYRLIGYENRVMANEDFENDAKDAGEVGASHQVTVCYGIKPAVVVKDSAKIYPYATLRVRYKNPGESLSRLNEYEIGKPSANASEDEKFLSAVIELCMLLHNSEYIGDITLEDIAEDLSVLNLSQYPERAELYELVNTLIARQK